MKFLIFNQFINISVSFIFLILLYNISKCKYQCIHRMYPVVKSSKNWFYLKKKNNNNKSEAKNKILSSLQVSKMFKYN